MALGKKSVPTRVKGKTQPGHEDAAEDAPYDQADQIEPTVFLAQTVPQYAPAESGYQAYLLQDIDGRRHISHESSSS